MANGNQIAVKKRLIYAEDLFEPVDYTVFVVGGQRSGKTTAMYEQLFRKRVELAPTIDALPLRCHMGDTVWVVGTKCLSGLYEGECRTKHGVEACDICPLDRTFVVFPMTVIGYLFLYIHGLEDSPLFRWGETVFKTQEEAEAALAKMKEADHGK